MDWSELHSRETAAGYDRARLDAAVILVVGVGAAGTNLVQNLALSGVGELRLVDDDQVEPSNLTRSPMMRRERLGGAKIRHKAREVAQAALALSYATRPVVRYAVARIEALGAGAFEGVGVVISAVDSFKARAWLADMTRQFGIPMIELGFSTSQGRVSVFPNGAADEPCWQCLNPSRDHTGISCATFARRVAAKQLIPATQPLAATFGAIASEAAIQALHGNTPLAGKLFDLDIRSGAARTIEITTAPRCPGVHRILGDVHPLDVPVSAPVSALLEAARELAEDPILHLPSPLLVQAPCANCRAPVHVLRPAWSLSGPPTCRECPTTPQMQPARVVTVTSVTRDDDLASRPCRALGLAAGGVLEIEDRRSHASVFVRLRGGPDELFTTLRADSTRAERVDLAPHGAPAEPLPPAASDAIA